MKAGIKKLGIAVFALLLAGCTQASAWFSDGSGGDEAPAENHTVLYGKVTAANGNEITVALGTKKENTEQSAASGWEESDQESGREEARGGGRSGGEMPQGEAPGDLSDGEMPRGETSGGMSRGAERTQLDFTREERTFMIPVGTPVHVSVGTNDITTDFMYIVVDNIVQMVVQEDGGKQTVVSIDILGS